MVTLRDLRSGKQAESALDLVAAEIAAKLAQPDPAPSYTEIPAEPTD
jgi:hypothetical protein